MKLLVEQPPCRFVTAFQMPTVRSSIVTRRVIPRHAELPIGTGQCAQECQFQHVTDIAGIFVKSPPTSPPSRVSANTMTSFYNIDIVEVICRDQPRPQPRRKIREANQRFVTFCEGVKVGSVFTLPGWQSLFQCRSVSTHRLNPSLIPALCFLLCLSGSLEAGFALSASGAQALG